MRSTIAVVAALAALAVAAGCGSATSAALGSDSKAEVKLISRDIRDLHLIVSPRQGSATQAGACSDTSAGFGCDRVLATDNTLLTFHTDKGASSSPYYVYVQNTAASTRTATLQIRMDGDLQVDQTFDIAANTTVRVARIFRNSADTH